MYQAIGVIELKSIAKGIEATDAALKSAGISLVSARPACPGKYEIILTGSISNVTSAVEHVKERFDEKLVDSSIMGRIDEQVITSLFGTAPVEKKGSLGIIETYSAASIIKAADKRSLQSLTKSPSLLTLMMQRSLLTFRVRLSFLT